VYLDEINDARQAAWCKTIRVVDHGRKRASQIAVFPEGRAAPTRSVPIVQVPLDQLRLERSRHCGACWLALELWDLLELDEIWAPRLPTSRRDTRWLNVLKTRVVYCLIAPGSSCDCIANSSRKARSVTCSRRI